MVRASSFALLTALTLFAAPALASRPAPTDDRTGSPYFMVDDPKVVESLPLESTRADIDVAGVIARVKVTQTYRNRGSEPIEATYVFPGSTRSAVFRMKMTIGDRTIEAKIKEKEAARKLYEQAKREGKSASLLEQHRPNVFQMNVANIMPGDVIKVEMFYSELLVPTDGTYELVYPTVVGPRYAGAQDAATKVKNESWTSNPYLKKGAEVPYEFGLTARLSAGMPLAEVNSPSHRIAPRFTGRDSAEIVVDDNKGGDRDFVLRYRLSGNKVQTGLLMFPGKDENFFLMMMQPPKRVAPAMMPPREYIFIMDVSGSMRGFPLNVAKDVVTELLAGLRRQDRFNIMFFSGGSTVLNDGESVPATRQWKDRAIQLLTAQRGGGGTRILPAMKRALAMPRAENMSTSIVVVTDGYVSVEKQTFDVIAENLREANLFTFGIGSSVNRHLIEGMARTGMGEPFIVLNRNEAKAKAAKFKTYIESPVLANVKLSFDGFDAYDVEPRSIPDVFAQRPVIVFGKYRGTPSGHISLSGYQGRGRWSDNIAVKASMASSRHEALRQLWARHKIARLDDLATVARTGVKDEVTKLGLKYSLMTKYTSFVAIDSLVRNHSGSSQSVSQPLPLPKGVPQSAVGASPARAYKPRPAPMRRMRTKRRRGPANYGSGGGMRFDQSIAPPAAVAPEPAPEAEEAQMKSADDLGGADYDKRKGSDKTNRRIMKNMQRRLAKCVEGADKGTKFDIRIIVGADGKVLRVQFLRGNPSGKTKQCVTKLIRKTAFVSTGRSFQLRFPLLIR